MRLPLVIRRHKSTGKPLAGVGSGVGVVFADAYFPVAKQRIRIASAYFSVTGHNLTKHNIRKDTHIYILVRKQWNQGKEVQRTVIETVTEDLRQCQIPVWEAVADVVKRIEEGKFSIKSARDIDPFHCKFYICDEKCMFSGSANYSDNGFCKQAEQLQLSTDSETIDKFIDWYDEVSKNARDLLDDLLNILKKWLELATPFEIYLKAILKLHNLPIYPASSNALLPVYYQKAVILSALDQAKRYGGSMVVAATGLGKTVIGVEIIFQLWKQGLIEEVVLIAPRGVEKAWKKQLTCRKVTFEYFSKDIVFLSAIDGEEKKVNQLENHLRECADVPTVVLIDEAHFFKNELLKHRSKRRNSKVYERLIPLVESGAMMFLLTATAYSTSTQNINSLLYLLPHYLSSVKKQEKTLFKSSEPWSVVGIDEFEKLPIVTTLGLTHVLRMAQDRGDVDENGRTYVEFSGMRQYMPRTIKLTPIFFDLPLQTRLLRAFDSERFTQAQRTTSEILSENSTDVETITVDTVYQSSINSWISSPLALSTCISRNVITRNLEELNGGSQMNLLEEVVDAEELFADVDVEESTKAYCNPMRLPSNKRARSLRPIQEKIDNIKQEDKLVKLSAIIEEDCIRNDQKIIVFVRRRATAIHVCDFINSKFKYIYVGCTVAREEEKFNLLPTKARRKILEQFSPLSHGKTVKQELDILVCTDADGVGINLQDANVVVNYDPPSGADTLFQRAGRIIRMTPDANRVIKLYSFIPSIVNQVEADSEAASYIKTIFRKVEQRHDASKKILGAEVFNALEEVDVMLEQEIDIDKLTSVICNHDELNRLYSTYGFSHSSILEKHIDRAEKLTTPIMSARHHDKQDHCVYVLVEHLSELYSIYFNLYEEELEELEPVKALNLLACDEDLPKAMVSGFDIEKSANLAVQRWCEHKKFNIEDVSKTCVIYLVPSDEATQISNLVDSMGQKRSQELKKRRK